MKKAEGGREMAQQIRVNIAVANDLSLILVTLLVKKD